MKDKRKHYWVESSYDFEDKEKQYEETLVVGVVHEDRSTETVAHFSDMSDRASLENLIKHFNDRFTF